MPGESAHSLGRPLAVGTQRSDYVSSRRAPGGGQLVVERCDPLQVCGLSGADDPLVTFLERRSLQKRLAERAGPPSGLGGGHIVPVHEIGVDGSGGYAVRDWYDLSAGDLIRAKTRPRADLLHQIVAGVLTGLAAIETYGGRSHGDLDADAVLLAGLNEDRLRVGLRHLQPSRLLGRDRAAAGREDLRRVGLLIYELVTLQPFRELGGYPVRESPAWLGLGQDGPFWLGLVNELLDPKGVGLSLGDVVTRVGSLRYRPVRRGRPGLWIATAAAVVLVSAGAYVMLRGGGPAREPTGEFKVDEFSRWYEASPGILALKARMNDLKEGSIRSAIERRYAEAQVFGGRKSETKDGVSLEVFEATRRVEGRISEFNRGLKDPDDVPEAFDRAVADGDQSVINQYKSLGLDIKAGLSFLDGEDQASPEDDLASLFAASAWPARATLESLAAEFDGRGWGVVASELREPMGDLDGAIDVLMTRGTAASESEVAEGGVATGADGPGTAEEAAALILESVGEIEELAGADQPWSGEAIKSLDGLAVTLAGRAELPDLGEIDPRMKEAVGALPEKDPVLTSLPELTGSVGRLAEGEGLEVFAQRLERLGEAINDVAKVASDDDWPLRVDLVELDSAIYNGAESGGEAGDPTVGFGEWLGRVEAWALAAEEAGIEPGRAPAVDLGDLERDLETVRQDWSEVLGKSEAEAKEIADGVLPASELVRDISRRLAETAGEIARINKSPRWPSLDNELRRMAEDASESFRLTEDAVRAAYGRLLRKPMEVIAEWRGSDALAAEVGGEWVAALEAARREIGGSVCSEWEAWNGAAGRGDDEVLRAPETDALRNGLEAVDAVLKGAVGAIEARAGGLSVGGGFDRARIEELARLEMARAIAGALPAAGPAWEGRDADAADGGLIRAVDSAIEGVAARMDALNADLETLGELATGLARCVLPSDREGTRGLLDRLAGDHAALLPSWPDRVGETVSRGDAAEVAGLVSAVLGALESRDAALLVRQAADGGEGATHQAVRYASLIAADEMGQSGGAWPADVASMQSDAGLLADAAKRVIELLGKDAGGPAGEMREVVFRWWSRGFGVARSEAEIGVLVDEGPGWFEGLGTEWVEAVSVERLEGAAKANAEVYLARRQIRAAIEASIVASRAAGADKERIGRDLNGAVGGRLGGLVGNWVEAGRGILAKNAAGGGGWEPSEHGPARALPGRGWVGVLDDDAEPPTVTYSMGAGDDRVALVFELVEWGGGKTFLATEELSVGVLKAVLPMLRDGSGSAGEVVSWLENQAEELDGKWSGPRAWLPASGRGSVRIRETGTWLDVQGDGVIGAGEREVPAYPDGLLDRADGSMAGLLDSRPSRAHPVTSVPYRVATALAQSMGCALPPSGVYDHLLRALRPDDRGWNLRDGKVAQQVAYVEEKAAEYKTLYKPGVGSFVDGSSGARTLGHDDGSLWFREVGVQPEGLSRFRNIVGNVAEFVGDRPAAVGGSALSSPDRAPTMAVDVNPATRYVDVGLRLSIPADEYGSLANELERWLRDTAQSAYSFGGN